MFASNPAAPTWVNPSRRSLALLSVPFAAVTLGTLLLYFLSDQTLEALRKSMQFSDVWMEADRSALLQLDRCIDLGPKECDLVQERLRRPLAYTRAIQERAKPHPDATVIEQSLKDAGLDASPIRFRLRWFDYVTRLAGLPLHSLEDSAAQNARFRGEMPPDIQTLFDFDRRARDALAHSPPDAASLAVLKKQIAAFRSGIELAKTRFDANSAAASGRLRRFLYLLLGCCAFTMFCIATWMFQRMFKSWQQHEQSFRERDHRLSQELTLHVRELQTALADKNALLQEVQHRVKNNLAVIAALLTLEAQQSANSTAENVLVRTRDRIHSMARVHDLLCYDGTAAEINFSDYVESLSRDLMSSFGVDNHQIQMHASVEARLGLTEAIPCGLILNEFLTNSLKHAFPNGRSGNIWFSLIEHDGQADLHFRDDGVGLPAGFDHSASSSLGMQLVSDLTIQMDGTLERQPGSGTHFHIRFHPRPQQKQQRAAG